MRAGTRCERSSTRARAWCASGADRVHYASKAFLCAEMVRWVGPEVRLVDHIERGAAGLGERRQRNVPDPEFAGDGPGGERPDVRGEVGSRGRGKVGGGRRGQSGVGRCGVGGGEVERLLGRGNHRERPF